MSLPYGMDLNVAAERAYPTPIANSPLLPLLLLSLATQKHTPDSSHSIKKEYDYIVVGAGMSGSVVAARLSEVSCVNVLLLEAGPPPPRLTEVPGYSSNFESTDIDWNYMTTPQKHTGRGLRNRQVPMTAGKALGGGSVLSAGTHVRGNRKNYDNWAAMGATGWSYKEVLPYFKKLEDNTDPRYVANGYHGVGGPVTISTSTYSPEFMGPIFKAAKSMGHRIVDPNARRQTGFFKLQATLRRNQKCTTAKAYLVPAENRTNLDILPNAMVEKVILKNRRATGVRFAYEGRAYEVKATREVIVSAGAVNTAQILMLSGIGPKRQLEKFNIPIHADLPVGENFHEHSTAATGFVLHPYVTSAEEELRDPENVKLYIHNKTGPLAAPFALSNIALLYNDRVNPKKDYPNYELYFLKGTTVIPRDQWNLKSEVYDQVFKPYEDKPIMMCYANQVRPFSRGRVTLKSANPYDYPVIDPNYLADPRDLDVLVQGLKTCRKIGSSPYLRKVVSGPFKTLYPGCEKYVHDEDRYLRCQVRSVVFSLGHPCGTAKMGDPNDPSTVVDPKLRVKTIKGLRVVDNSIMASALSGNPSAPAMMIGEKASDLIKDTIQCRDDDYDYDYDDRKELPSYIESEDYEYDDEIIDVHRPHYQESGEDDYNSKYGYDDNGREKYNYNHEYDMDDFPRYYEKDYDEENENIFYPQGMSKSNREYEFSNSKSEKDDNYEYKYPLTNKGFSEKEDLRSVLFSQPDKKSSTGMMSYTPTQYRKIEYGYPYTEW